MSSDPTGPAKLREYLAELEYDCALSAASRSNWSKYSQHLERFLCLAPSDYRGPVLQAQVLARQGHLENSSKALLHARTLGHPKALNQRMQEDLMRASSRVAAVEDQVAAAKAGVRSSLMYMLPSGLRPKAVPQSAPQFHLEFGLFLLIIISSFGIFVSRNAETTVEMTDTPSSFIPACVFLALFFAIVLSLVPSNADQSRRHGMNRK